MIERYRIFLLALLLLPLLYGSMLWLSDTYYGYKDQQNYANFLNGSTPQYLPSKNGLTVEMNVLFYEMRNLSLKHHNILLIGASTTREGIISEEVHLPENWTLTNLAMSGLTVDDLEMQLDLLNNESNKRISKEDIIVLHILDGTFIDYQGKSIDKSAIEFFQGFSIDENNNVQKLMPWPLIEFKIINYRIKKLFPAIILNNNPQSPISDFRLESISLIKSFFDNQTHYRNKSISDARKAEIYKANRDHWEKATRGISFPGSKTEKFLQLVNSSNKNSNVIVINMYIGSWHQTQKEAEYEAWINAELIPYLKNENITYIDYSKIIPDLYYYDAAHIGVDGRRSYSHYFNSSINDYLVARMNVI